jgi:proteasome lid subunit RPN8/RPN11
VELVFSGNEFFKFSAPDLLQPLVAGNSNAMIHSHQDHDPELSDWDLETSKRYRTPVIMIVTGGKKPSIKMGANGKKFAVELVE